MNHLEREVRYWANELGPQGPGFVVCRELIDVSLIQGISEELQRPEINWDSSKDSTDQLGNPVRQVFEVFSHKLSNGNQVILKEMPNFKALGDLVVNEVVQPLNTFFPSLKTWQPDEITAQKYINQIGKLSWHRDLARHPGIIAISNITGSAELGVRQHMKTHMLSLYEGDILLIRAPLLFNRGARFPGR